MNKLLSIPYWAFLALLVYMPFHIFLSQWLSTYTGGLEVWKAWKDVLLFFAVVASLLLVYIKNGFKDKFFWAITGLSVLYVLFHFLIWAINPDIEKNPALLATVYNCRLFGYLILGFATALLVKSHVPSLTSQVLTKTIFKIVLVVSTIVCLLALLQWFLPKDILTHFGYSVERGVKPNFFIDDKPDLPRAFSTLRDPNSLGAYLILPITLLSAAWFRLKSARMLIGGLLALHGLILFLTFSRSALLGAVLAVATVLFLQYKAQATRFLKKHWLYIVILIAVFLASFFLARDNYVVQNVVLHADENTQLADPNEKRIAFYQATAKSIINQPIGHGPGTAGLVSIQTDKVVLTENYFLQIAYEIGLLGLLLLLYLMYKILKRLYQRQDFYGRVMVAGFVGITFSNLLLHTWSNEAVAAQWWLLAGVLLLLSGKKSAKSS
ncbi:MAG TPA: O-antigen ligase family protein [Candidatus Saccharimonadales bacterium]|nr:O-antigen ligase family protein [Candidatus Saccharimonadales bacterium]